MDKLMDPCSVKDCNRKGRRRDQTTLVRYCDAHFKRLRDFGDPLSGPPVKWGRQKLDPDSTCSDSVCDKKVIAKGMCSAHYAKNRRKNLQSV